MKSTLLLISLISIVTLIKCTNYGYTLTGTVTDSAGKAISEVTISLINEDEEVKSDSQGVYAITNNLNLTNNEKSPATLLVAARKCGYFDHFIELTKDKNGPLNYDIILYKIPDKFKQLNNQEDICTGLIPVN